MNGNLFAIIKEAIDPSVAKNTTLGTNQRLVELNAYIVLLFAAYIFAEIYRSSTNSSSRP